MSKFIDQNHAFASVIILLIYFLMVFSPFLIPLIYALWQGSALPKRIRLVFAICAQTYGIVSFGCVVIYLAMELYIQFFVPRDETSSFLDLTKAFQLIAYIQTYWWLLTVFFLPPIAFYFTRKIGRNWARICQAYDG